MDEEAQQRFEAELCWCIQKLESSINSGKLKRKQVEDATKTLKTLQSSKAPLVKKRQVMSMQFGNYRSKMEEENKKIKKALYVKVKEVAPSKKTSFVRKSSKKSSEAQNTDKCVETKNSDFKFTPSDNSFKFQFDEIDQTSFVRKSSKKSSEAKNTDKCVETKHSDFKFTSSDNSFKFQFEEK